MQWRKCWWILLILPIYNGDHNYYSMSHLHINCDILCAYGNICMYIIYIYIYIYIYVDV